MGTARVTFGEIDCPAFKRNPDQEKIGTRRKYMSKAHCRKLELMYLEAGVSRIVSASVDENLTGNYELCMAGANLNRAMARYRCNCHVLGLETCSDTCSCRTAMKICGFECLCHGFCCNSFATLPNLDVRNGALGRELYTVDDLPYQKLAFVVCGHVMSEFQFQQVVEHYPCHQHYVSLVSWPGSSTNLPGIPGEVTYVVDPSTHFSGMANHSCDPNVAVGPW